MSRSPSSPAGKRMRTMNDSDDTSDDDGHKIACQRSSNDWTFIRPSYLPEPKCQRSSVDAALHLNRQPFIDDDDDDDDNNNDRGERQRAQDDDLASSSSDNDEVSDEGINPSSSSNDDSDMHTFEYDFDEDDVVLDDGDIEDENDDDLELDSTEEDHDMYDTEEDTIDNSLPDEYLKHDPTPNSQYPKPEWITVKELQQRRLGFSSSKQFKNNHSNMYWFEQNVNNSLWMIQRLELTKRLDEHSGFVNCVNFNEAGNLLCSGSADLTVCIWDWQRDKLKKKINTSHQQNVLYCQFCCNDSNMITSSRDGTVRLIDIESGLSEVLLSQSGEIGKLAFITPQTLVTCSTNAYVNLIDLRCKEANKLLLVRNPRNNRTCALHSINSHPLDKQKVVVAGESPYVFLYDLRRVGRNPNDSEHKPTYCIDNKLENSNNIVTSTALNSMGDKLLISYNDDDLYVYRTDTCEAIHKYTGHRNKKTIKGCAWFGDSYVLSGSDDGHIYGWDLESEHIVCFLEGDIKGIVNSLSVHPRLPILASSGLDHNVKVWEPTSKIWPQTLKGIKPQICKNAMRRLRAKGIQNRFHGLRIDVSGELMDVLDRRYAFDSYFRANM